MSAWELEVCDGNNIIHFSLQIPSFTTIASVLPTEAVQSEAHDLPTEAVQSEALLFPWNSHYVKQGTLLYKEIEVLTFLHVVKIKNI